MYKRVLLILVLLASVIFSFSVCFANDNMAQDAVDGVRNVVNGAENAVENAAGDISNASKSATNSVENKANDIVNNFKENGDNSNTAKDTNNETYTSTNNGNYIATRTSTEPATLMGMNSTAWTWLILGLAAIAIVALVWYYSMQMRSSNYNDKD